ncbi:MAG: hypothetical protein LC648_04960 [Novosphingobium sp.]|nr:hypothetical protein [Novosphingobium sp.]
MRGILTLAGALALAPLPAAAEPVPVRLVWDGNDAVGGILVNRVRGLIASSSDKRETADPARGLAVLVQTIDPAAEFGGGTGRKPQVTVYSLVINVRRGDGSADTFGTAALGYCAFIDVASCSREVVAAIDEEIARRGLG